MTFANDGVWIFAGGRAVAAVGQRLWVGNIPNITWQTLKEHFRQAGNVKYAQVMEVKPCSSFALPISFLFI